MYKKAYLFYEVVFLKGILFSLFVMSFTVILSSCGFSTDSKNNVMVESKIMNYEESCKYLKEMNLIEDGDNPPLLDKMPQYDDEEPFGINFFRTDISDVDLSNLTIPRTYFGRTEIKNVSFKFTNLSESNVCWNDLIEVDFTNANLSNCDMRASIYKNVKFNYANLENVDFRYSSFENCDFTGAVMKGVKITKEKASLLKLEDEQIDEISWKNSEGEEPNGG